MAFLRRLFQSAAKSKRDYPNIRRGVDPLEEWTKVGELGDGAFGKVYKVSCQLVPVASAGGGHNLKRKSQHTYVTPLLITIDNEVRARLHIYIDCRSYSKVSMLHTNDTIPSHNPVIILVLASPLCPCLHWVRGWKEASFKSLGTFEQD